MSKRRLAAKTKREVAFYYPGPVWHSGNWVKNLVLFFDGIALLVPKYIKDKPDLVDPAIAAGLRKAGLLVVLQPEKILDKARTQALAATILPILTSGVLDPLGKEQTSFHELSYSRLGSYGDGGLATEILNELKARNLARDSEDGVSIPMHPMVRALVLVLLAQILRPHGESMGVELSPATDRPQLVEALTEFLSLPSTPSSGLVVASDLKAVGVDLGPVPIDEVLDFRREFYDEHRAYARAIRQFAGLLGSIPLKDRKRAMSDRLEEIGDIASELRRLSRKAWKKPASFALGLAGATWTLKTGDPFGALLALGSAALGLEKDSNEAGAYSYLFRAADRFGY